MHLIVNIVECSNAQAIDGIAPSEDLEMVGASHGTAPNVDLDTVGYCYVEIAAITLEQT